MGGARVGHWGQGQRVGSGPQEFFFSFLSFLEAWGGALGETILFGSVLRPVQKVSTR